MKNNWIITIIVVVIVGASAFFAGMQYQKGQAPALLGGNGQFRRFGSNGQTNRPVRGQVLSVDSTGLTVKLSDGSSKIVIVSPSTAFMKSTAAAQTDLKSGDTVMVVGTTNSDGSVTAQNVAINPPGGQGPRPTGVPSGAAQ